MGNDRSSGRFGYTAAEYHKFRRYGYRYLILVSVLYCLLYCIRLNLSAAAAPMIRELSLTTADIGILTGTLFWTYGIGSVLSGRFAEVFGPQRFIILSVLLSAAFNIAFAFTKDPAVMAVLWGLNGLAQSMTWPACIVLIAAWWPSSTHGFATGFISAFSGFGQAAATLAVSFSFAVLPGAGYRAAFLLPPLFPLLGLAAYLIFARTKPEKAGLPPYVEENREVKEKEEALFEKLREKGPLYPYRMLLSNTEYLLWLAISGLYGMIRYGLMTWIPLYFIDRFGIDVQAGLLQSLALPVGMGIGTFVVPWLTDRLDPKNRLPAVVLSAFLSGLFVLLFIFTDPRTAGGMLLIQFLLFFAGFFVYAVSGVAWTYSADVGGRALSGTSSGILGFVSYLGAGIQALVYGFLLRSAGWTVVFLSIAAFCLVETAISIYILVRKRKR